MGKVVFCFSGSCRIKILDWDFTNLLVHFEYLCNIWLMQNTVWLTLSTNDQILYYTDDWCTSVLLQKQQKTHVLLPSFTSSEIEIKISKIEHVWRDLNPTVLFKRWNLIKLSAFKNIFPRSFSRLYFFPLKAWNYNSISNNHLILLWSSFKG